MEEILGHCAIGFLSFDKSMSPECRALPQAGLFERPFISLLTLIVVKIGVLEVPLLAESSYTWHYKLRPLNSRFAPVVSTGQRNTFIKFFSWRIIS
ncbi:MAG: hypothetical protein ACE1Y4_09235, partial [Lysobacterales bacterium]